MHDNHGNILESFNIVQCFQMYRLAILQSLLPSFLCVSSDLGAATLLSYSTAVDENVWDPQGLQGQQVVGRSQKYEQFLPPPPGFLDTSQDTFGLKEIPGSLRDSRGVNTLSGTRVSVKVLFVDCVTV